MTPLPPKRSRVRTIALLTLAGLSQLGVMAFLLFGGGPPPPTPSGQAEEPQPPTAPQAATSVLPPPPFELAAPQPPSAFVGDVDVRKQPPWLLASHAKRAAADRDWERARQLQHWAVTGGHDGTYDLACYHARTARIDGAIYWLQRAAIERGTDAQWAREDADLDAVRADPRWATLDEFHDRAGAYWQQSKTKQTVIVLPKGGSRDKPLPVVVGLHGYGSGPHDFGGERFQAAADALGVAFIAPSGTVPLGPRRFRWTESTTLDEARIDEALAEMKDRLTVAEGRIVLMGFSQGAQMSADIAARRPSRFAGAIVMSPGTKADLGLADITKDPAHAARRFVVLVGAGESRRTVGRAESDTTSLRALDATVFYRSYAGMNVHSFPPDFDDAMPTWVKFVLGGPTPR